MRLDLVRRTKNDVSATAIGLPSRDAGGEMLVRIRNTPIVFFFEFVLDGIGGGVATQPEALDEVVALLVVGKLLESVALFVCDDPGTSSSSHFL